MKKTLIMLTTLAIATTMGNLNNINNTNLKKQYDNKLNNNLINQINFTFSDQSNDNNYFKTTSIFSILKKWNDYANSWEEFIKAFLTLCTIFKFYHINAEKSLSTDGLLSTFLNQT